jgi:hypothetical protein
VHKTRNQGRRAKRKYKKYIINSLFSRKPVWSGTTIIYSKKKGLWMIHTRLRKAGLRISVRKHAYTCVDPFVQHVYRSIRMDQKSFRFLLPQMKYMESTDTFRENWKKWNFTIYYFISRNMFKANEFSSVTCHRRCCQKCVIHL